MLSLAPYLAAQLGLGPPPYLGAVSASPSRVSERRIPHARPSRESGTGTGISAGLITDIEPNNELKGQLWYGARGEIGISGKMMRDPHVRQSVAYVIDPLVAATWRFKPASLSPLHVEQAAYATWAFIERMAWDQILRRTVTAYCRDGASVSEMLDDVAEIPADRFPLHPGGGVGVVPTEILDVPLNTVDRWWANPARPHQLRSITQWQPHNDVETAGFREIAADRLMRITLDQEGANFAGFSKLRSAYGAWKCKLAFMAIDAIKHERRGVGTPILIFGEEVSEDDIAAAEQVLAQMRTNAKGYATFPNGSTFTWDSGNQGTGTDLDRAIQRCNIDIAINVSAGFMLLSLTGGTGSYALGATQQSQYHLSIVGHAKLIGFGLCIGFDGWSPLRRLLELNYGPVDALPTLEARNLPTRNWLDVLPQLINATNAGLMTADDPTEDELREIFQICARDPDTARAAKSPGFLSTPAKDVEPKAPDDDATPMDDEDEPAENDEEAVPA